MVETSHAGASDLSDRSIAVALITIARFLASEKPGFVDYLGLSLKHAQNSGLLDADLATLRLIVHAIGV